MNLSTHFTLEELIASETASRRDLNNMPSPIVLDNLKRLAVTLEAVRGLAGRPIVITSGYRAPAVNKAVGGAASSFHVVGLAVDMKRPGSTAYEFGLSIIESGIEFDQIIHEYRSWVHLGLSHFGQKPRRQILTINHGTGTRSGWNK